MQKEYEWVDDRAQGRKRILFLSLIIVLLIGLGTWGGVEIDSSNIDEEVVALHNQTSSLLSEYEALEQDKAALEAEHMTVQAQYEAIANDYKSLQTENSQVQTQYEAISNDYKSLQVENSQVQTQYEAIANDYRALQKQLTNTEKQASLLQEDAKELQEKYLSLTKLKQFEVDDNLQISFHTEEEILSSRWITGEVRNIGLATVDKAYIFVFRYNSNGSLAKTDFPPTVVTSLGPGETAHFSFLAEGEPFKIMAVGDY